MKAERPRDTTGSCLGEISADTFLRDYWQKKPLLVRAAFPDLGSSQTPLLSAEELAGLACEDHVNARLVINNENCSADSRPWQLEFGPFEESRFSELPESNWSLLVSDVERHLPETRFLLKPFRFIPDWRIDDLMVSYAPAGGSVGAHTDAYDVFLIQLNGRRRWQISENFSDETIDDIDLSILKEFHGEQEWILEAGDMLYLPPNIAHLGTACDYRDENNEEIQCLTASVGFRAPSTNTISSEFMHFAIESLQEPGRYSDSSPAIPSHHAEISDQTVDRFLHYIEDNLKLDRELVRRWVGQYCSDNRTFEDMAHPHEADEDITYQTLFDFASQTVLMQSPYSNFLFSHSGDKSLLFVDGITYPVSQGFAESLCDEDTIDFRHLDALSTAEDKKVMLALFRSGAIVAS